MASVSDMQDRLQVAIKQITLKSVPGKLSNIRQKEISILKVKLLIIRCALNDISDQEMFVFL